MRRDIRAYRSSINQGKLNVVKSHPKISVDESNKNLFQIHVTV